MGTDEAIKPVPESRRNYGQIAGQIATLVFTAIMGGVATLGVNWYSNRATVVEYSVDRTILGTNQTSVVPNFRVQVGDTSLQSIYLYTVKVYYGSGPELEEAKVGIELKPSVKLVGNAVPTKPGEAYSFKCEPFTTRPESNGTTCILRRLNSHVGTYSLSFAADREAAVQVSVDAKNTEVRLANPAGAESILSGWSKLALVLFGFAMASMAILIQLATYYRSARKAFEEGFEGGVEFGSEKEKEQKRTEKLEKLYRILGKPTHPS